MTNIHSDPNAFTPIRDIYEVTFVTPEAVYTWREEHDAETGGHWRITSIKSHSRGEENAYFFPSAIPCPP